MIHHHTAEAAEAAFYRAFETGDLTAMLAVWADDDDILCVHPVGTALRGRNAVATGWRGILSGDRRMHFRVETLARYQSETLAVHIVHEHITLHGEDASHPPIVATNIYRRSGHGWRMVEHHASPTRLGEPRARPDPVIH